MLTENVHIALRSGASSIMISMKSPPIGAGPTTRMTSPGLHDQQRLERVDDRRRHQVTSRMSMS